MKYTHSFCMSSWWRHQMETFSAVLAICPGNPVNSQHKGQCRGALMFSLICVWINDSVKNREAGDLRWHRAYYDVIVMDNSVVPCRPINAIKPSIIFMVVLQSSGQSINNPIVCEVTLRDMNQIDQPFSCFGSHISKSSGNNDLLSCYLIWSQAGNCL